MEIIEVIGIFAGSLIVFSVFTFFIMASEKRKKK
jgi:hypothetical protein